MSAVTPALVGEPVPATCHVSDVLRHLHLSRRTFERLMAARALAIVELPRLGRQRRFTGASVDALKSNTRWAQARAGAPTAPQLVPFRRFR
jgi:hypothetical protein